jgi:DNA-binding transcriptional MerR regulator
MELQQISFSFGDEPPGKPKGEEAPSGADSGAGLPEAEAEKPGDPTAVQPEKADDLTVADPEATPPREPEAAFDPEAPISPEVEAPPEKTPLPKGPRGRKSVKEMAASMDLVDIPEDEVLFQKQYYPIGEVAAMFQVNTSLIRFWETEFNDIHPRKNKKGDRFFTPADIKTLQLIHFLLRQKKLTIEGAKEYLKAHNEDGTAKLEMVHSLEQIKAFLLELKVRL